MYAKELKLITYLILPDLPGLPTSDSQKTRTIYLQDCVIILASVTVDDYTNTEVNKNIALLPKNRTITIEIERLWVNKQQRIVNILDLISG